MINFSERLTAIVAENETACAAISVAEFEELRALITRHDRIFIAGAGRTGLVMKMLAMRLAQTGATVLVAGDSITPACESGDLLLIGSGSGSTASMLGIAEKAAASGATVALITRTPASKISSLAQTTLLIPIPLDNDSPGGLKSCQPLGTLFEQALMLTCDLLVEAYISERGITPEQMQKRHANLE